MHSKHGPGIEMIGLKGVFRYMEGLSRGFIRLRGKEGIGKLWLMSFNYSVIAGDSQFLVKPGEIHGQRAGWLQSFAKLSNTSCNA